MMEFQVWRKEKEDWAFSDLQMEARDRLPLNHLLDQIMDHQINFAVKQRCPKTLDEAVAAILEMKLYRTPSAINVGQVISDKHSTPSAMEEAVVCAVRALSKGYKHETNTSIRIGDNKNHLEKLQGQMNGPFKWMAVMIPHQAPQDQPTMEE